MCFTMFHSVHPASSFGMFMNVPQAFLGGFSEKDRWNRFVETECIVRSVWDVKQCMFSMEVQEVDGPGVVV